MDIIYLPYVEWDDSLHTVIERMKALDCRWAVVHYKDSQYRLHSNRAILEARTKGVALCAGLQDFPGEPIAFLEDDLAQNRANYFWELVESTLDQKNAIYGLPFSQFPGNQMIAVVTRHEGIGADLRATERVCSCEQGHEYSEPPPVDGTNCQHDGTQIECL